MRNREANPTDDMETLRHGNGRFTERIGLDYETDRGKDAKNMQRGVESVLYSAGERCRGALFRFNFTAWAFRVSVVLIFCSFSRRKVEWNYGRAKRAIFMGKNSYR